MNGCTEKARKSCSEIPVKASKFGKSSEESIFDDL